MSGVWVDRHWVLRLLRADHPELSARAKALLVQAEQGVYTLHLSPVVLAEAANVLSDAYEHPHKEVAGAFIKLLTNPAIEPSEEAVVGEALELMRAKGCRFSAAYTAVLARARKATLSDFGGDYKGLGVATTRVE